MQLILRGATENNWSLSAIYRMVYDIIFVPKSTKNMVYVTHFGSALFSF